jgi:hypothetical protein
MWIFDREGISIDGVEKKTWEKYVEYSPLVSKESVK